MINRVVLTGRLTRNPELKSTNSSISVATFTLAVDQRYKDQQGNRGADFISCVIWRKAAENFCNFTNKGSLVGIDGRLQTRTYDDKNGNKVYVTEVVVDNFSLLESKKDREKGQQGNYRSSGNSYGQSKADPFNSSSTINITDSDLPF